MSEPQVFLPYGRQKIDEDDIAAVVAVLRGDWLTGGPSVGAFEKSLASYVGAKYSVSCSSGTAALHLAALALGLGPGDAVVVPSLTFLATANAVRFVGAEVIFADVDPENGLMGPIELNNALEKAKDKNIKAVFPVHLNGQCSDLDEIHAIASKHGMAVVEDACHALGTVYTSSSTGELVHVGECRHGGMVVFSFHPVKTIAMGEGGAVMTRGEDLAQSLRSLRNHGMTNAPETFVNRDLAFDSQGRPHPWYYEMPEIGYNYRASDIHCALGLSQLGKLDDFIEARRALVDRYDQALSSMGPVVRPIRRVTGCSPGWHLYVVLIDFALAGISRAELMRSLREQNIGTQVHYLPVHQQPYYRRRYGLQDLPGADAYYAAALSLPLFPSMTDNDVYRVVDALKTLISI